MTNQKIEITKVDSFCSAGIIFIALGLVGEIFNKSLQVILSTGYPNVIDQVREALRIQNYPIFLIFVGGVFFVFALARKKMSNFKIRTDYYKWLAWGMIAIAISWSVREWCYWGSPLWDNYGDISTLLYNVLIQPDAKNLSLLKNFAQSYIHVFSLLTPVLTALLNVFVKNITASYMTVIFSFSLGTGFILKSIIRRFYNVPKNEAWAYLILFFSHYAVMRSMVFPQTDAVVMFFSTLVMWLAHLYISTERKQYLYVLAAVLSVGIFSKIGAFYVSFVFLFSYLWIALLRRSLKWKNLALILLASVAVPALVFTFYVRHFHLYPNLLQELHARLGSAKDRNPKLFVFTMVNMFQMYVVFLRDKNIFKNIYSWIPAILVLLTVGGVTGGSLAFWSRFFLPIVPALIILSVPALERMRLQKPIIFNMVLVWSVVLNCTLMFLRLYY
jgi:hypothetical protein